MILFQRKLPAAVAVVCLSVLILLILLTQDAMADTKAREEAYTFSGSLSQLIFRPDYPAVYGEKLDDMKYAYDRVASLGDYFEWNTQFLYLPDFPFEDRFLYLYEEGHSDDSRYLLKQGDTDLLISAVKTVQLGTEHMDAFALPVQTGRPLDRADMDGTADVLPILAGSEYAGRLQVGDRIDGLYIEKWLTMEVVGILAPDACLTLYGHTLYLDRYLVMPSFCCGAPADEDDQIFQVRHYANKLSGFFPSEKAAQVQQTIAELEPLSIGSFSFAAGGPLTGLYARSVAAIGLSTQTIDTILAVAALLLFPLLLLYLLRTSLPYLASCCLAGASVRALRRRTVLSAAVLFVPPLLLLYGGGALAGLALRPTVLLLAVPWLALAVVLTVWRVSSRTIQLYLGRDPL